MDKPLAMRIKETRKGLVDVCNASGLPLYVLEMIIGSIYNEVRNAAEKQSFEEEKVYYDTLKKENEEKKDVGNN